MALGDIQQGKTLRFNLWKNSATGEVFVLNAHQDRMPVQSLWCGESRDAYNSRRQLALPDRRGRAPRPITLRCAAGAQRVNCRPASDPAG
ncbi:hypothetical protein FJU30_14020 [Affinibrenneria salicis]|uniref:Uncharacterized protein n=1 Tax=Affinibrenneria salicis TaxID=2590031 RepID=A0A5J5FZI0_9GAMM|nr:hypothetical protein [Affinibrenneria salicis]KAA8999445.1 hypothetical protein FJU30_14020 [Affinibrenneria salicis]